MSRLCALCVLLAAIPLFMILPSNDFARLTFILPSASICVISGEHFALCLLWEIPISLSVASVSSCQIPCFAVRLILLFAPHCGDSSFPVSAFFAYFATTFRKAKDSFGAPSLWRPWEGNFAVIAGSERFRAPRVLWRRFLFSWPAFSKQPPARHFAN